MNLSKKSNHVWQDIVTGKKSYQLKFLAAEILLGRLTRSAKDDQSTENINACVD